jgi:DNA-binding Lrp family transcriptional regulator
MPSPDIEGVSEVYSVAGEFDLVAIVRVSAHDELSPRSSGRDLEGIRGGSNRDSDRVPGLLEARLEALFTIGFAE